MLAKFPSVLASSIIGLAAAGGLFWQIYATAPVPSLVWLGVLCLLGRQVFGFGLLGFVWSYRLIWRLRRESLDMFMCHRLAALSAYVCTLSLIGIVPIILTFWFSTTGPSGHLFKWFGIFETVVVIGAFSLAEASMMRLVANARSQALEWIGRTTRRLWNELENAAGGDQKDLLERIDKLDKFRQAVLTCRVRIIPWDAICSKILLPVVIGLALILAKREMESSKVPPNDHATTVQSGQPPQGNNR